uniref:LIM domain transcription factor LMO4 n=1 Tax=Sus scrofa TaxID=9823 RepID=A0A8D1Z9D1_PIG
MAVTTMACERCCLKYEKPVSQLYTAHPPLRSPRLPSHPQLPFSPRRVPPFPFWKPNSFQLGNCSCTSRGSAGPGTWLRRGPPPRAPRRGPGRGRARRWVGSPLVCCGRRRRRRRGRGRGRGAGAGRGRRREGWSARRSLAPGVLTVPELGLSAAASAGKLRGARGPRTKLEKSKQAAAARQPPPSLSRRRPSRPGPAASFQQTWGDRVRCGAAITNFCIALFFLSLAPSRPLQTMVNPGSSSQPPPVTAGSLSWKRCAGCGGKIADRFLLYAMDSYWHSRCLKCSCCQAQLGDIGTSCYTKSGMILCRNDYIRLFGNSGACSACGQSIPASELVMRAQGNVYHLKCFTCSTCRNRLVPGDRFHYINGSLFCEHDRPTALINGHLNSLQSNPLLPDQKVC